MGCSRTAFLIATVVASASSEGGVAGMAGIAGAGMEAVAAPAAVVEGAATGSAVAADGGCGPTQLPPTLLMDAPLSSPPLTIHCTSSRNAGETRWASRARAALAARPSRGPPWPCTTWDSGLLVLVLALRLIMMGLLGCKMEATPCGCCCCCCC